MTHRHLDLHELNQQKMDFLNNLLIRWIEFFDGFSAQFSLENYTNFDYFKLLANAAYCHQIGHIEEFYHTLMSLSTQLSKDHAHFPEACQPHLHALLTRSQRIKIWFNHFAQTLYQTEVRDHTKTSQLSIYAKNKASLFACHSHITFKIKSDQLNDSNVEDRISSICPDFKRHTKKGT